MQEMASRSTLQKAFDTEMFRALAEPVRVEILGALLRAGGSTRVGDVASSVNIDPSGVSRHLRELARAGVVSIDSRGRERWCTLELDQLIARFSALVQSLENLKKGNPCC